MIRVLSLRMKITLAFLGMAVFSIMVTMLSSMLSDQYHFKLYVEQNQQLRNEQLIYVLEQAYQREGQWLTYTGRDAAEFVYSEGVRLKLLNENGQVVWDTGVTSPSQLYPLRVNGQEVGSVAISKQDPDSFTRLDWHFMQAIHQSTITAVVPLLLLAMLMSVLLSGRLSKPLLEMNRVAKQMASGDLDARVQSGSGGDEIGQLAHTLNILAGSLQEQQKLRQMLTEDVAHELRTPLTSLKSHIEAILDGIWQPTPARLTSCYEEVERLIGLVASLDQLNQADHGREQLHIESVAVGSLLQHVSWMVEAALNEKGVTLAVQMDEQVKDVAVDLDQARIKQVLLNVLSNSLKYTPVGGSITISSEVKDSQEYRELMIRVQDTGEGIDDEDIPYVFERLYRADRSRSRHTGGAGIGLAIVKKWIEAHRGTVTIQSQLGKGTTVTITLPMKNNE